VFASERAERRHHVLTRQGESVIEVREDDEGRLSYRYRIISGRDPLGYANRAEARALLDSGDYFEGDRWAAATRHTLYPDGVVQVAQLLEAKAAGDLIVEPAPGVEPWTQGQRAVHGALHRDQLVVPLLIHGPQLDVDKAEALFARGPMPRTVDVYPTVLELLDEHPPRSVAWRVSKWFGLRKVNRRATMRTDIDGRALDIWALRVPTASR
jgi:hypothetical protein